MISPRIEATTNQAVCHIIPDPKIAETRYVYHELSSQVPSLISMGVPTPQIAEQMKMVSALKSIETLKATHSAALQELDRLFASLQHRAFQGEL